MSNAEHDLHAALMSMATNSGLGRFYGISQLWNDLETAAEKRNERKRDQRRIVDNRPKLPSKFSGAVAQKRLVWELWRIIYVLFSSTRQFADVQR